MAPGPETAAVWQQKLISPLCCHRPTLVSRSKQWPACSSYRAWPPAFLTGGPPYNQENVNPHRELLHNVLLSHCPGRSKEDHTHCWAYSKAHCFTKRHTVRREGTLGGFHPCWENLRKPSKLAAATSYIGNKINSSHKGFILEHKQNSLHFLAQIA